MSGNALIKFEWKSIEKLINLASKGMWTLYKPRAIRNEADAKAYEAEVLAKAEAKKIMIEWEAQILIRERAQARLWNQEIKRQENLEEIIEKSIPNLPESVSEIPVDEDWRTRFFNKAQDVSSEQMQEVWAKILADETAKPWNISLRTLDLLSNVSQSEAKAFWTLITLITSNSFIFKLNWFDYSKYGVTFNDLLNLEHAGLISMIEMAREWKEENSIPDWRIPIAIWYNKYLLSKNDKTKLNFPISFQVLELTPAWTELCQSLRPKINEQFYLDTKSFITNKWFKLEEIQWNS